MEDHANDGMVYVWVWEDPGAGAQNRRRPYFGQDQSVSVLHASRLVANDALQGHSEDALGDFILNQTP
jgi:hypothetical protein